MKKRQKRKPAASKATAVGGGSSATPPWEAKCISGLAENMPNLPDNSRKITPAEGAGMLLGAIIGHFAGGILSRATDKDAGERVHGEGERIGMALGAIVGFALATDSFDALKTPKAKDDKAKP